MNYTGRRAEYAVLAHLLAEEVEAYPAIKTNQDDYDITVVRADNSVIRVQVKGTDLNSKGTNNAIANIEKTYDFLVVVVIDGKEAPSFYVLSKDEALQVKGQSKHLYVTRQVKRKFFVKGGFLPHKDRWDKIRGLVPVLTDASTRNAVPIPRELGG